MAGHNKWSKVKHIKAVVDAKKGKIFGRLSKELTLAAKSGGEPDMNPRLRTAILAAKAVNMPSDNIERAIKKGTGELASEVMEEAMYEGFAPGGVAVMVEVVTDNKNRSFNDIRTCFGKLGGTLGGPGSVSFNFERRGEVKIPLKAVDEMQLLDWAAEAGANDVVSDAEEYTVYTSFEQLNHVVSTLRQKGLEATSARMIYFPLNSVSITDKTTAAQIVRLCEALEDLDDSQNVWVNFDIPDEIMAGL